jgi:DNA-directed RNA polymerase specialized sigma24 family protein
VSYALRPVTDQRSFETLYNSVEPLLRQSLVARYGSERGREATAEALAWAWEHREKVQQINSPVAYLFRVGQSRTRPRKLRLHTTTPAWDDPWVEPGLAKAIAALSENQRTTVFLLYGFDWRLRDVATLLGVSVPTVQTHASRGLAKLREHLGSVLT